MKSQYNESIYYGNSIISIEQLPEYAQPVVIKKPANRHPSQRRLRILDNEHQMTRALNAVEGVRKALGHQSNENQSALILEYIEGETLRDHMANSFLDLRSRLEVAVDLCRILSEIHQKDIIHLDINSKNVLIGNKNQAVYIIDLGAATRIDRSGRQKVGPDQLLGTLPYISPEQTGRINRAVDERSDLYALGVVLYELMTGQLPFDAKDPLELVHDHIARVPVSPSEVSPGIPEVLSAIILKLLSKNAEDRYQSAAGIQADLEKCLQRLSPEDTIEDFSLGEADFSGRLRFPQKLYGRDHELKELESAFESVLGGTSSIVFVSGYSGIGKTALIEEIQRPVSEKKGYFIEGKFDQLVITPYAGVIQALTQFVSQILTQSETQLAAWRSTMLEAVGPNGRVLTDIVPRLELVIGPQPAVPDLSGQETQNRFNYVFQCFFGAIARSEHPFCLFLDDLQWIDPGTLGLLKALFSNPDLAHLLIVGAYRDNEVHADHPLMTFIVDLEKAGVNLRRMTLQKLAEANIEALISDTLQSNQNETRAPSRLIYSQAEGNPFFTRQVLHYMEDRGLLALDTATGHWDWDMDVLRDLDVTASVVELLVGKLKELPVDIRETLKVAACIGNQFDIATLTVVAAGDDETIVDHVHEAVVAGLIWERDDRIFFVHDRVQEAAYALVPPEERNPTHLTIGRLLLQKHGACDDEQDLYRIVDQVNHGLHLIEDEQERMQIARLNLQAARAAGQTTAFETGLNYARAGIELLGENSWEQDYRLILDLQEQAALLALAAGDIPKAEHHGQQVLQFGREPLDLARVQKLHIELLLSSRRSDEAIDFGLEALRILGQEFPANPDIEFTITKLSEFFEHLEREPPDYFSIHALEDQDSELFAVSEILSPVATASYVARPALSPLIFMRILELALERQLLPASTPLSIAALGFCANGFLRKLEEAYSYGETAVALASQLAFASYMSAALHLHAMLLYPWRKHLRETLGLLDRSIQSARNYGNNEYNAYSSYGWSKHAFYASIELTQVEERSLELRQHLDSIDYNTPSRWINIFVTAAQVFRGGSADRVTSWRGTPFDDDRDLPDLHQVGDQLALLYAHSSKAWVATFFGDHTAVEEHSDLASSFLTAGPSLLENATLAFVCGLRYARELREKPNRPKSEQALEEHLGQLKRFAAVAPMNFAHKLSLVQAEKHRARGETVQAMQAYEKASQGARENGYLNEAGLAHALAAEFYQELGLHQAALHNVEQAVLAWQSWGAHALVESLRQRFADLLETSRLSWQRSSDAGKEYTSITEHMSSIQLDMESIVSASHMLSAETDLEQLLSTMIALVMANSGAETAILLLKQDKNWFVQARGESTSDTYDVLLHQPFDPADKENNFIPESVFRYCLRSKELLVVRDVTLDQRFFQDRMLQKHQVQSLACIPALSQGELKALVYLENRQLIDVFTLENVGILTHLSAQFAVSLENAVLYERLNHNIKELEVSETRFRSVVEHANETIVVTQDDFVKYSNHKVEELTGYSQEEMSSLDFETFIHPEDLNIVLSEYQARLSGEKPASQYTIRIITKQGQTKYVVVNSALITWDGRPATLALLTDITTRKRAEQQLKTAYTDIQALKQQLQEENIYLQEEIQQVYHVENIVGQHSGMKHALYKVQEIAPTDMTVLILGETGTGKELFARAIHRLSSRNDRALVKVNCAALSATLIESELFGHEKGAFTGADQQRKGRFELANGATLFLDEIGELPLDLQAKLLQVLQNGEFERLGGNKTLRVDVRILAATNRDLATEIQQGRFRKDLYYRLNKYRITIPPLRDRLEDIPLLVTHAIKEVERKLGKAIRTIPTSVMQILQDYSWPGNVRELENVVEQAVLAAQGDTLYLPPSFQEPELTSEPSSSSESKERSAIQKLDAIARRGTLEEVEREYIQQILEACYWRIGGPKGAAVILGLHPNTLRARLNKLGLQRPSR